MAACEGVLKTGQGAATGEWLFCVGVVVGENLEEGVMAEIVGIVVVRIASEQGVDPLLCTTGGGYNSRARTDMERPA